MLIYLALLLLHIFYTSNLCAGAQLYLGFNSTQNIFILIALLPIILIQCIVFKIFLKNTDSTKLLIAITGSNAILILLGFLLSLTNRFFRIIPTVIFLQSPLLISLMVCVWIQYLFINYLILPDQSFEKIIYPLVISNVIIDYLFFFVMVILYFVR